MRIRYFSFVALAACAVFLIVASQAFALLDIANLALGVGIAMFVLSAGIAGRYRRHMPSFVSGVSAAVVSAWMIVASQVFSLPAVQNLTFAEALASAGLALVGLTAHELSTERVVHSLTPLAARDPAEQQQTRSPREPVLN